MTKQEIKPIEGVSLEEESQRLEIYVPKQPSVLLHEDFGWIDTNDIRVMSLEEILAELPRSCSVPGNEKDAAYLRIEKGEACEWLITYWYWYDITDCLEAFLHKVTEANLMLAATKTLQWYRERK